MIAAYNNYLQKKIIHIDMDSFFASVEIRDKPTLVSKPIAVGGTPNKRGVIATSNYIARKYGIHSAMPTAKALKLCPQLIIMQPNMEKYKEISENIKNIFYSFTDQIEPLSLDEAYLDVTNCNAHHGSATLIAINIRKLIYQKEKLIASAGVAPNKFLAKVASDWKKPNGLFVITPEQVNDFVAKLPVHKIPGVGKVMAAKLANLGIFTCKELQNYSLQALQNIFGSLGNRLYNFARGIDGREVQTDNIRKSLSVEETFPQDIIATTIDLTMLSPLIERLSCRLSKIMHNPIYKLFIKVKFANFTTTTAERIHNEIDLQVFYQLLKIGMERNQSMPIRLIGIGVKFLEKVENNWQQLNLLNFTPDVTDI